MFRKNILSAYLTSLLGVFSGLLTQFVYIKSLTSRVSMEELSLYLYVFQVVTYFAILQLGLDFATSREIAYKLGQNDMAGAAYSFKFIKKFNDRVCLIGLLAILIISTVFFNGWGLPKSYNRYTSVILVFIFGMSQVVNFLSNPYAVALIGANFQRVVNINNVVVTISSTLIAVTLLFTTTAGILAMPMALLFFYILNFFLLKRMAQKKCAFLFEKQESADSKTIRKQILSFSVITTIGGLAWTVEGTSDIFILSSSGLFYLVGLYVIWWRFPQMLFDLATRLTTSAFPSLTTSHGRSNNESKLLFNKLFLIVIGFALLIGIGISIWLPSFIHLWVGSKFEYANFKIISILAGLIIANRIIGNCFGMFLISIGNTKITSMFSWIQAIVKVVLGIFLTRFYGLEGLFFATFLASCIQVFGLLFLLIKRNTFIANTYFLIILPLAMIVIPAFYNLPNHYSVLAFVMGILVSITVVLFSYIFMLYVFQLPQKIGFSFLSLIRK